MTMCTLQRSLLARLNGHNKYLSFVSQCLEAAKAVIRNMIESLAPSGYMRYAPDGVFP